MSSSSAPSDAAKQQPVKKPLVEAIHAVDAAEIAKPFREHLRARVASLSFVPLLVGLLANRDAAAKKYAEWTQRACEADGIKFELRECDANELEDELMQANKDAAVHGIMVYWPCFGARPSFYGGSMDDYLRDSVAVEKDVEGLCYTYRRNLYRNVRNLQNLDGSVSDKKCLLPCTPLAIVKVLEHLNVYDANLPLGDRLKGKTVTVVNRSEIVGRPIAAMLANDGADVFSVDIDSVFLMRRGHMVAPPSGAATLEACVRISDVVITGVPTSSWKLPCECLMPGVIVINVSHFKNVDEAALSKVPGVRYVPQVGKVTVSMLERNLLRLVEQFHDQKVAVVEAGGRIVKL
jgi:methylenetetrahydrofolate dehydrogenase (NAD+)